MVSRKMTRLLDCCLFSLDMDFCPEVQPAQKRKIKFNCTVDESNIWKFSSSSTHASWALVDLFILILLTANFLALNKLKLKNYYLLE